MGECMLSSVLFPVGSLTANVCFLLPYIFLSSKAMGYVWIGKWIGSMVEWNVTWWFHIISPISSLSLFLSHQFGSNEIDSHVMSYKRFYGLSCVCLSYFACLSILFLVTCLCPIFVVLWVGIWKRIINFFYVLLPFLVLLPIVAMPDCVQKEILFQKSYDILSPQ